MIRKPARQVSRRLCWVGFCVLLLLVMCPSGQAASAQPRHGQGLFSWKVSVMEPEERERLFSVMRELSLTELYQYIPSRADPETTADFLSAAAEARVTVYLLTGEPEWGLDPNGDKMTHEVRRAAKLGMAGVMMDVEIHQTPEWDRDANAALKTFVRAMINTRKFADEAGVELIACIPGNYDALGFTKRLMRLVRDGCHTVAVMNYNKRKEVVNIIKEVHYAQVFGKELINIYELQAAGKHGLMEHNTYHEEGLDAVRGSYEKLRRVFPDCELKFAIHNYDALLEVMGA